MHTSQWLGFKWLSCFIFMDPWPEILYFTNTVCSETVRERRSEEKKLVIAFIRATTAWSFIGYAPVVVFYTVAAAADDKQIDFKLFFVLYRMVDCFFASSLCWKPIAFRSTNFPKDLTSKLDAATIIIHFFSGFSSCENSDITYTVCVSQVNLTPKVSFWSVYIWSF